MCEVRSVRPAQNWEWDAIWRECPYSTYFHSRPWAELWRDYNRDAMRPAARLLEFSDGCKALLPFSLQSAGLGIVRVAVSSPEGTTGGWLSRDDLGPQHTQLLTRFMTGHDDIRWRVNAFDPALADLELPGAEPQTTRALPLCEDFDAVFRRWSKGHRSAVKQAQREGVSVRVATGEKDWRDYYDIYQQSLERWGELASSRYGWRLFARLAQQDPGEVKLWIAEADGRLVAGAVCLYAPGHVVYWHGAADADAFSKRPVHLMLFEAIRHACDTGLDWFDFNPSGGNAGVDAFKSHFGTVELAAPVLKKTSRRARWLAWLKGERAQPSLPG